MGLDIMVHRLVKPHEEDLGVTMTEEYIRQHYGDAVLAIEFDTKRPGIDFPEGYAVDFVAEYYSERLMFEEYKKTHPEVEWGDGWEIGGDGTSPVCNDPEAEGPPVCTDAVEGCEYYIFLHPKGQPHKHINIPVGAESFDEDSCVYCVQRHGFLTTDEEFGYMRGGANEQFYKDMKAGGCRLVFTKEKLEEYARKYFDEDMEDFGNARACFKGCIQDAFGQGEDDEGRLYVDFWY